MNHSGEAAQHFMGLLRGMNAPDLAELFIRAGADANVIDHVSATQTTSQAISIICLRYECQSYCIYYA